MIKRILFVSALVSATSMYAQPQDMPSTTPPPPPEPVTGATQPTNIPGGYTNISVNDPNVVKAANFAVQQLSQGTLVKIASAQVQIVAGKNYSLSLILSQNGVNSRFDVTVFDPLPNSGQDMQLTDVEAYGETDNAGDTGINGPTE